MNEMQTFTNPEFGNVRTVSIDGEPWLVGRDVAAALGYSNTKDAIGSHVDAEDKQVIQRSENATFEIPNRGLTVINESGLYSLVLSSRLPSARRFRRWVTSEILPSIRRHGLYAIDDIIANPDLGIAALVALKAEREKNRGLTEKVAIQNQRIAEMQPKVTYYDLVLSCPDALPITVIAKDYGWSGKRMNKFLHEQGVQYKLRKTWLLYAHHADKGYTRSETYPYTGNDGNVHNAVNTKWTQKGRLFIYSLMKAAGYLPKVEKDNED